MGLQSQLNDVSSDSIPLLLLAIIATCVNHIRSSLSFLLGICRFHHQHHRNHNQNHAAHIDDDGLSRAVGSPLAGLIVLAEQLNLNRLLSNRFSSCDSEHGASSDCVVCLSAFRDGDHVRRLSCRHVFHKKCFDGWLDHMNFSCPLCRTPLVCPELVDLAGQRVGRELIEFYSIRSGA